ncbi:MAG TPA: hypothetical protein VHR84_01875 [Terriglobales bacterium]|jgi:hypothetical protein|nr:hypothetical protein [Terriglobales bacterium]
MTVMAPKNKLEDPKEQLHRSCSRLCLRLTLVSNQTKDRMLVQQAPDEPRVEGHLISRHRKAFAAESIVTISSIDGTGQERLIKNDQISGARQGFVCRKQGCPSIFFGSCQAAWYWPRNSTRIAQQKVYSRTNTLRWPHWFKQKQVQLLKRAEATFSRSTEGDPEN